MNTIIKHKNRIGKRYKIIVIDEKHINIDDNFLEIGYREKSKPYDSKIIVSTMDPKYADAYLNAIERAHRGFEHSNNTYYGYNYNNKYAWVDEPIDNHWDNVPESIPYGDSVSYDPNKILKKGLEGRWLDVIEKEHRDFEHSNTTYYGYCSKNINQE